MILGFTGLPPLVKPAADAMARLAGDVCHHGALHYGDWLEAYEALRVSAARMICAERGEIAIVKNISKGRDGRAGA
jgi:hypothetical protein